MALKWQTGAIATITLSGLLFILLNLAGMSHSHDGDKTCTDCYSEIQVKSTFWEIKAEHAGDKNVLFKKRVRSRTLWVNLDKIDELVTTDPKVKVDILVPAIKRTSSMKHPEYGYLRPLKDGDVLIKRNRIASPSPSRIILHGSDISTTVKWNFDLESPLIENINIDPTWFGQGISNLTYIKDCKTITTKRTVIDYEQYLHYVNGTRCSDEPINKSCSFGTINTYTFNRKIGTHEIINNKTICRNTEVELDGQYGKVKFNWEDAGFNCKLNNFEFVCDSVYDGNGDGIVDSGESYIIIDVRDLSVRSNIDVPSIKGFQIERR